jgi:hypothetical protein
MCLRGSACPVVIKEIFDHAATLPGKERLDESDQLIFRGEGGKAF